MPVTLREAPRAVPGPLPVRRRHVGAVPVPTPLRKAPRPLLPTPPPRRNGSATGTDATRRAPASRPPGPTTYRLPASVSTSSRAVSQSSSSAPTCAWVPRRGSRVGHPLQRLAADVEDHRVPGGGGDLGGVLRHAAAAEVGAGVVRRLGDGPLDLVLGEQALHAAARDEPVVEALVVPHVGVLQVDQVQLGGVPAQALALAVALEQLELGHPVELAGERHRVGWRAGRAPTPSGRARRGSARRRRCPSRSSTCLRACSRYSICSCTAVIRRPSRSVTRWRRVGSCETARSADTGPSTARSMPFAGQPAVLDHREDQRGRADLEVGRDLRQVGVADDHVQPAVLVRVGVRLVAGVDDRALERGLEADLDLEVVGALAQLEALAAAVLAEPRRPRRSRPAGRRRTG